MRDFKDIELKRLKGLELKIFDDKSELYDEVCLCIIESEIEVEVWKSDSIFFNDGRACICISSDDIDVVHEMIIYHNSFCDKDDKSVKILSFR